MGDLLTLGDLYSGASDQAVAHLKARYGARDSNKASLGFRWVRLDVECEGQMVCLDVGIPSAFPDLLPKVTVSGEWDRQRKIPHVAPDGTLCVFDDEQVSPNPTQVTGIIDATLDKAIKLLGDGLRRSNLTEFRDELEAYWAFQADTKEILSIVDASSKPKQVQCVGFIQRDVEKWLLADSLEEADRWLSNLRLQRVSKRSALYLPIDSLGHPPYPITNKDLLFRLQGYSPNAVKPLVNLLDRCPRPTLVIGAITPTDSTVPGVLLAWEHGVVVTPRKKGQKRRRSAFDELVWHHGGQWLPKYSVTRVDRSRLQYRGGTGDIAHHKVAVVGCGAIGSHLTQALVHMGVHEIHLMDPDSLSFDNIARHLCGAVDVGRPKTEAVRTRLVEHSPHLHCVAHPTDVLGHLVKNPTALNGFDLVVVAVAKYAVERRLSRLVHARAITSPVLFVWVEPFMAGGHAFLQQPGQTGCFDCLFDGQGVFKQRVLSSPGGYLRRETGCVSTFAPYAVLEVDRFISALSFFIQSVLSGELSSPHLYTWLGDINTMKRLGRKVDPRWSGAEGNSSRLRSLTPAWLCEECKK